MPRIGNGSIHLFRVAGIDVMLHWSWIVVALIEISGRSGRYSSIAWNALEYLALFGIVLLHEFGHALACRQVGGTANRILLWPLGGVAYVNPPQKAGATLWSIAAGPLVNIVLLPFLAGLVFAGGAMGWALSMPDFYRLLQMIFLIDKWLLIFNILPIYPLDGGQMLRSLLWFAFGRARSLAIATGLGMVGALAFVGLALWMHSTWSVLIAAYMVMSCWGGLTKARALLRQEKRPRRVEFACPSCGVAPPMGPLWRCSHCKQLFDTFAANAVCPQCSATFPNTMCGECRQMRPISEWAVQPAAPAPAPAEFPGTAGVTG